MSEPQHRIDDVPLEIWLHVSTYLSKPEILALNKTNRFFHQLASPLAFKSIIFHLNRLALNVHGHDPNEDKAVISHIEDRTSRFRTISKSPKYAKQVEYFIFNGSFEGIKAMQAPPRPAFMNPPWQLSYETAVQSVIPGLATFVSLRSLHLRTTFLDERDLRNLSKLPQLRTLHMFQIVFTGDSIVCPLALEDFSIGGWRPTGYEPAPPVPNPLDIISPTDLETLTLKHECPDNHSPILHALSNSLDVCTNLTNIDVVLGWDDMEPFLTLLNKSPNLESLSVKWNRRLMADEIPQDILRDESLQRLHSYNGPVELVPIIFPNRHIRDVKLSTSYWLWSGVNLEESATATFSYLGQTSEPVKELVIVDRIHLAGVHFELIAKYLPELRKLKIDAPAQSWRMNKLWQDLCSGNLPLPPKVEHLEICTENVMYVENKEREYFNSLSRLYPNLEVVSLGSDECDYV
ncbi:hypothetical protein CVT24_009248 [Panaeolus cyanescens]|uniref:F-box domain-containing protein n=1 Tax=Panaeolus cyanescens TaxID=181874 RepID=A0A409Y8J2_9AGAR|nr:hypothetical protein CVT24_009248 [Panaeolus cyanescens]